jgi:hypothetical protein
VAESSTEAASKVQQKLVRLPGMILFVMKLLVGMLYILQLLLSHPGGLVKEYTIDIEDKVDVCVLGQAAC